MTYDNRNQMTGVSKRATDGGTLQMIATYVYDVWGNRIESDVWQTGIGTTTVHYALDGWKSPVDKWNNPYPLVGNENFDDLLELDGGNSLTMRRIYGNQIDQPLARIDSGGTAYDYLADRQSSIVNLVNNSGVLSATMAYDGFGNQTTSPAITERFGYTGRERDSETGFLYERARSRDEVEGVLDGP
jgi:hypothetical protein